MSVTLPNRGEMVKIKQAHQKGATLSAATFIAAFDAVQNWLSSKPLERPLRLRPLQPLTGNEFKSLAKTHQPPQEWFAQDEDCPF